MTTSLQNCLKAVRKIEGKKLEDEFGVDCHLQWKDGTIGIMSSFDIIRGSWNIRNEHDNCMLDSRDPKEAEILGNPNNFLQRVLGALNKKYDEYEYEYEDSLKRKPIYGKMIDIAFGHAWNHSKDIQEDSTYDKITELLINH